jgi:hypothetical protein
MIIYELRTAEHACRNLKFIFEISFLSWSKLHKPTKKAGFLYHLILVRMATLEKTKKINK